MVMITFTLMVLVTFMVIVMFRVMVMIRINVMVLLIMIMVRSKSMFQLRPQIWPCLGLLLLVWILVSIIGLGLGFWE